MESNTIQLKYSTILNVPLKTYDNDFTFVINGDEFKTSRIISDLLSPKICKLHLTDPTIDSFIINTHQRGNFYNILNLINFNLSTISDEELPFILEVFTILEIESIEYKFKDENEELTINNVFSRIKNHEKLKFFSKRLSSEIDFISSRFYEICETKKEELKSLSIDTIDKIINNEKLELDSEDQLLHFVNELFVTNSNYSFLYEYVQFENISCEMMKEFISIYDIDFMNCAVWKSISMRLEKEVKIEKKVKNRHLYKKTNENCKSNSNSNSNKGIKFEPSNDNSFSGILNHLRKKSNGNIENEVNITASSIYNNDARHQPRNVVCYENNGNEFYSKNQEGNWLCFDFKEHRIIPTDYTIKSYDCIENYRCTKSWVIEISNDNENWEVIDEENNCSYVNGKLRMHTFHIQKPPNKESRYIRIKSTSQCWNGEYYFNIGKFEIYGTLI